MGRAWTKSEDLELLAAAAQGEREAFAVFYRRHLPSVVSVLVAETHNRELAADLTGEVFAAALLAAGRYRPEHATAAPWLAGIARNKARDSLRRGRAEQRARRRVGVAREPVTDADLERVDQLASLGGQMLGLLDGLPEPQRLAVQARVIEELEYSQIAAASGVSEALVRQRVRRGLSWLRARSDQEDGG
jgi:RNA polymerase sigma-70 factor (ECF subfamily)